MNDSGLVGIADPSTSFGILRLRAGRPDGDEEGVSGVRSGAEQEVAGAAATAGAKHMQGAPASVSYLGVPTGLVPP